MLRHLENSPFTVALLPTKEMPSSVFNGQRMLHAAVNTDPLQPFVGSSFSTDNAKHYGLKERNISHIKINEKRDLNVWYAFGEKIGEGAFGTVVAVVEKTTGKMWAMKSVTKKAGDRLKLVQQEVKVLKLLHHPHIIFLDKVFESARNMYMVFEKCKQDFGKVYRERKPFAEKIAKKIFSDLVDAVAYLHKYDIVHRDLKMENMLLGENPDDPTDEYFIKLTDFGLAVIKTSSRVESMLHDYCGTLIYMAPEVITVRSYSQSCDVWSLGVILYMLVTGKYPFYSPIQQELRTLICTQDPTFNDATLSREVKDLILLLLVKKPVDRITATEAFRHPWIVNTKLSITVNHTKYNILHKMKKWKSEMQADTGPISDWARIESTESLDNVRKNSSRQPMNLPKTNIQFDRSKRHRDKPMAPKNHPSDSAPVQRTSTLKRN